MAVEGVVFVGIQTVEVLRKIEAGASWHEVVPTDDEQTNGNGALMRVLPLALRHVVAAQRTDGQEPVSGLPTLVT